MLTNLVFFDFFECNSLTSGSCLVNKLSWLGSNIVDDLSLEPWGLQVPAFPEDYVSDTADLIELECSVTGLNFSHEEQIR